MNYLLPHRLDLLAREYALGTLAGPARRRFERVMRTSRAATLAVDVWRERLSVLDLAVVPLAPPASNWHDIERRLFRDAPDAATAATARAPAPPGPGKSAWQTALGWFSGRVTAGAMAGGLAGVLACAVFVKSQPASMGLETAVDAVSPSYVGLVLDAAGKPIVVVSSRRLGRQLTMKMLQPLAAPTGQVAQLWALPKNGAAPFPIGVLPASGSARATLPDVSEKLFANVAQVAVSFEATPAAAGGKPSGAFVFTGNCVKVW